MYTPRHFVETDVAMLHGLMRAAPLATLIVHTPDGLVANHIPFSLHVAANESLRLQAHIPRVSSLCEVIDRDCDGLLIFQGPEGYVSPSYYATKKVNGKVVPTWNYAVVHAHGSLRLIEDTDWVRRQIHALTDQNERDSETPWTVDDAPPAFTDKLLQALVGVEMTVKRLEGKSKLSQNQPRKNQQSVLAALADQPQAAALSELMHARLTDAD